MKKRLVSLVLVLCMVIGFLPAVIPEAKAAVSTEAEFAKRLAKLQKDYVDGEYWNWYNVYNGQVELDDLDTENNRWNPSIGDNEDKIWGSPAGTGTATCSCIGYCTSGNPTACNCVCGSFRKNQQCAGYALKMFWLVWGTTPQATRSTYSLSGVYAGDIIDYYTNSEKTKTHTIFVTRVSDDAIYYTDCNNTGPCQVRWGATMSKSSAPGYGVKSVRYCTSNPGLLGCDHSYNDVGICTTCNTEYDWASRYSSDGAGIYTVAADGGIYLRTDKPYSASTAKSDLIAKGTKVEVLGSAINHYEKRWYKVSYNGVVGYTHESNLTWYSGVHSHSYSSKVTKEATCIANGVRTYTCSCGNSYTESIPMIDHSYGSWTTTKNATCTETGTQQRTCNSCGAVQTQSVEKVDHYYDSENICMSCGLKNPHAINFEAYHVELLPSKQYIFQNVSSGKRLNIPASLQWVWDDNAFHDNHVGGFAVAYTADGTADQLFTVAEREPGLYSIHPSALSDGHLLQVYSNEGTVTPSMRIETSPESSDYWSWQLFYITAVSETEFVIVPSAKKALCMSFNNAAEAATNFSWACVNTYKDEAFQKWYIFDADGNQVTASQCSHDGLSHMSAMAATCTEDGNKEYWYCSECDKYFSDAAASVETTLSAVTLEKQGHSLTRQHANEPTCESDGSKEFWVCFWCEKWYLDEAATVETSWSEVRIPGFGHNYVNGACDRCGKAAFGVTASGSCGENVSWYIQNGVLTIYGSGAMADNLTYATRDEIPWVFHRDSIEKAKIQYGVTNICKYAFYECHNLRSVEIEDSVTDIGANAFGWCDSLKTIVIPDSVANIGERAFWQCYDLSSVTIGRGIKTIGDWAFSWCDSLETVDIADIAAWCNVDFEGEISNPLSCANKLYSNGVLIEDIVIPNDVQIIKAKAFDSCSAITSVTIPDSVVAIGENAFLGCNNLSAVHIEDIAAWCDISFHDYFSNPLYLANNLYLNDVLVEELVLPYGVATIGNYAFANCDSLTSIMLPDSMMTIGAHAFFWCDSLISVTISDSVTTIGDCAFYSCDNLASLVIGDGVITIGPHAFYWCDNLTSVTIPGSVKTIGNGAFYNWDGLTLVHYTGTAEQWSEISIGEDNAKLANAEWHYMELTSTGNGDKTHTVVMTCPDCGLTYGETVTEPCADEDKNAKCDSCGGSFEVVFASGYCGGEGDGTNLIWTLTEDGAFTISGTGAMKDYTEASPATWYPYKDSIKTVTIGDEVTSIGGCAFYKCNALTSVAIPDSVTTIGDYAFSLCSKMEVTIPDGVVTIGSNAFSYCDSLTTVTIPDSVTTIGSAAFSYCDGLMTVTMGNSVTTIGGNAFTYCVALTSVELSDSITTIGPFAFTYCTALTSVTIPDSVESIGIKAFADCSSLACITVGSDNKNYCDVDGVLFNKDKTVLVAYPPKKADRAYAIPGSVTTIGDNAFYRCTTLTSVKIPDSVTAIGDYAFYRCEGLISVVIPDSVTSLGGAAFSNCYKLASVTIGNGVTVISSHAFFYCYKLTSLTFGDSVESIGGSAFYHCIGLTSVTIPDSVTTISFAAFHDCDGLTSVTIPDSVTIIGRSAFEDCDSLTSVAIPNSVTAIECWTFAYSDKLASVTIPDSITAIDDYAFYACDSLSLVHYTGTVEEWDNISVGANNARLVEAERHYMGLTANGNGDKTHTVVMTCPGCGLTYGEAVTEACADDDKDTKCDICDGSLVVVFASGYCGGEGDGTNLIWTLTEDGTLTISGFGAMKGYDSVIPKYAPVYAPWYSQREKIKTITIDDSVTTIGTGAFYSCECLISVTIPDSVTTIGAYAFYGCDGLPSVVIPNGVKIIGSSAFSNCDGLPSVELPDSVKTIGSSAFSNCDSLTSMAIPDCVTTVGTGAFSGCDNLTRITVDSENQRYSDIDGVLFNKDQTVLIAYPGGIAQGSYTIPDGVTTIEDYAFFNCYNLSAVTIGGSVTNIGAYAFCNCSSLTALTIGDSVTNIGTYAFWSCDSLATLTIGDSVTNIGTYAFYQCDNLATVTIGDSVTIIGRSAFEDCDSLTSVVIGDNVTTIGDHAFYSCKCLISVTIPDSVTTIEHSAFSYCDNLTSVTLGDGVTNIGTYAFDDCDSLILVHYTGTVEQWDEIAVSSYNTELTEAERHYMKLVASDNTSSTHTGIVTCPDCGLTYGETVTKPCTDEDKNAKCDICGGTVKDITPFAPAGSNMTLGNELVVNIMVKQADITAEGLTAYVTHHEETGDTVYAFEQADWATYTDVYYSFSVPVAAAQMTDQISIEIKDADGNVYNTAYSTSACDYVGRVYVSNADKVKTLMVDMLNYGAAAQEHFGYRTEALANAGLTEEQQAMATGDVECTDIRVKGTNYVGSNLSLQDQILLNFMFTGVADDVLAAMTAKIEFTDVLGNEVSKIVPAQKLLNKYAGVAVDQIVLADSICPVTVTLYNADGTVYGYATDSVESYNARQNPNGDNALYTSIMKFAASAYAYKQ